MIITPKDMRDRLHEQPFAPLRILTTTGNTYDIYHPELVMVGDHFLMVGMPSAKGPGIASQITRVALIHVCEVQDLPPVVPPSANGSSQPTA